MDEAREKLGAIVLAAGASSRMNEPKQLLEFEGETLLRRAVQTAVESVFAPVVVVLGANFEKTNAEIEDLPVEIIFNENWRGGLSSSIKIGIERLLEIEPQISAALITLADQPFVKSNHLNLFAEKFLESKSRIIAAEYEKTVGVPALFGGEFFAEFLALSGDTGAKSVIKKHSDKLTLLKLPEAATDIDTPQDFTALEKFPRFR